MGWSHLERTFRLNLQLNLIDWYILKEAFTLPVSYLTPLPHLKCI